MESVIMDATECIKTRRSIRKFTDEQINPSDIEKIVELASYSPSWKNTQTVRYNLILNAEIKNKIADECVMNFALNQHTITNAPALIVISSIIGKSGYEKDGTASTSQGTHWQSFDAGVASQTFCLVAHSLGLATVIMGIFDNEKIARLINLSNDEKVSALIAIGHSATESKAPKRKTVDELLRILD